MSWPAATLSEGDYKHALRMTTGRGFFGLVAMFVHYTYDHLTISIGTCFRRCCCCCYYFSSHSCLRHLFSWQSDRSTATDLISASFRNSSSGGEHAESRTGLSMHAGTSRLFANTHGCRPSTAKCLCGSRASSVNNKINVRQDPIYLAYGCLLPVSLCLSC